MRFLPFNHLKNMDTEELKENHFLIKQDMNPKYCTEPDRVQFLKKKLKQVEFLLKQAGERIPA